MSAKNQSISDLNREANIEMSEKKDSAEDGLVKADVEHEKNVDSNDEGNSDDNIQSDDAKSVDNIETDDAVADDKKMVQGDTEQADGTDGDEKIGTGGTEQTDDTEYNKKMGAGDAEQTDDTEDHKKMVAGDTEQTDDTEDHKKMVAGDTEHTDDTEDNKKMGAGDTEQAKDVGCLTTDSSMQETADEQTTDEHPEQPGSRDRPKRECIYAIGHKDIEKVAQEIMDAVQASDFKEKDLKTLEVEEINDSNNIDRLILFQVGTRGFCRSEDTLNACRLQHQKVTSIIIVCICKDNKETDIKDCSEHTYSRDQDIIFEYHVKANGNPHDCSSEVINNIRSHVHGQILQIDELKAEIKASEKTKTKQKKKQVLKVEGQKLKEEEQELKKDIKPEAEVHEKLETTDEHPEQPGSHDRPKREYIYAINDEVIKKVAKEIMEDVKESCFKKKDLKTEVKEITDSNNIACLIVFQVAPCGSSRCEDRLDACRKEYKKVTNIIIVCVGKDNDENHYQYCSEQPVYSKDQDIVFKYHIKADCSPHDCSSNVIKNIRSHVHTIVMRNHMEEQIAALMEEEKKLKKGVEARVKESQLLKRSMNYEITTLMEEKRKLEEDITAKREDRQKLSNDLEEKIKTFLEDNPASRKEGHKKFVSTVNYQKGKLKRTCRC